MATTHFHGAEFRPNNVDSKPLNILSQLLFSVSFVENGSANPFIRCVREGVCASVFVCVRVYGEIANREIKVSFMSL